MHKHGSGGEELDRCRSPGNYKYSTEKKSNSILKSPEEIQKYCICLFWPCSDSAVGLQRRKFRPSVAMDDGMCFLYT